MGEQPETAPKAQAPQLAAIDLVALTPIVQGALNSDTVELASWDCEQLPGGVGAGTAVHRFAGQARDQGQAVSWSLILKVLHPQVYGDDLSAWNYYRREADAYQSGWLDDLPGGLAAPRSFGTAEHPDGTCWIWLEDVTDDIGRAGLWSTMASSPATSASSTNCGWGWAVPTPGTACNNSPRPGWWRR
jgi:hypothetical protein